MVTREEAKTIVEREIAKWGSSDIVVLDEPTIEKPWGWVFFYNSQKYIATGEAIHALAGNAPFIVNRNTGALEVTGTAKRIEEYVSEYEKKLKAVG